VLRTAHIAYYKTAAEYQLLRLLELPDVHSCSVVALKKHNNTFGLVSAVRTFYLQAQSASEVKEWVSAIEAARQTLAGKTPSNAHPSNPIPIPSRSSQGLPPTITPSPPSFHPSHSQNATSSDSEDASPGARRTYSISSQNRPSIGTSPSVQPGAQGQSAPSPSVKDSSKTILSGYLMKCGSKRRHWKKRWFVLTGEKLFYSGSHMVCLNSPPKESASDVFGSGHQTTSPVRVNRSY
jgi:pleckstrin homology domain-containing family A member 1/2